jgi:RsiW-degrading membrane proteinase PrsW (M82 family)
MPLAVSIHAREIRVGKHFVAALVTPRKRQATAAPTAPVTVPLAQRWIEISVAVALLGSACLLDPWAQASSDAPKRFVALLAAVVGGAVLILRAGLPAWRGWTRPAWWIVSCAGLGLLGLLLATLFSPHPLLARDALRTAASPPVPCSATKATSPWRLHWRPVPVLPCCCAGRVTAFALWR